MKKFYEQPVDSDIKRYQEKRKVRKGQGEDYTTRYLLHYNYIKNHYRLIAVNLSRQKELDTDPKAIPKMEFVGQLKTADGAKLNGMQSMFVLIILEKIKETKLNFFQRKL